jgi:hypothetical protein
VKGREKHLCLRGRGANEEKKRKKRGERSREKRVVRAGESVPPLILLHQRGHKATLQLHHRRRFFQMPSCKAYRKGRGGEERRGGGEERRGKKAEEGEGNANFAIGLSHALK